MTRFSKFATALGVTLALGSAVAAQEDGNAEGRNLEGMTCGDFLMAEASDQIDVTNSMGITNAIEVEIDAETLGEVDTIDNNVRALAAACQGHEEVELMDIQIITVGEMNAMNGEMEMEEEASE